MGIVKPNLVDFAFDCNTVYSRIVDTAVVFRWIMFSSHFKRLVARGFR